MAEERKFYDIYVSDRFETIQREYIKVSARLEELEKQQKDFIESEKELEEKIKSLEEAAEANKDEKDASKREKENLKILNDKKSVKLDLEILKEGSVKNGKEITELSIEIKEIEDTFSKDIPQGLELLNAVREASFEERRQIKNYEFEARRYLLKEELFNIERIEKALFLDPDFREEFESLKKYSEEVYALLKKEKELGRTGSKLSKEEKDKLTNGEALVIEHVNNINKYCKDRGYWNPELISMFTENAHKLSIDENIGLLKQINLEKNNDLTLEQTVVNNYYDGRIARLKLERTEPPTKKDKTEKDKDKDKDKDESKDKLVKLSLWKRFKRRAIKFFKGLRGEEYEEKKEKPEESKEKPEESKEKPEESKRKPVN